MTGFKECILGAKKNQKVRQLDQLMAVGCSRRGQTSTHSGWGLAAASRENVEQAGPRMKRKKERKRVALERQKAGFELDVENE
jgi:hypothetical protein